MLNSRIRINETRTVDDPGCRSDDKQFSHHVISLNCRCCYHIHISPAVESDLYLYSGQYLADLGADIDSCYKISWVLGMVDPRPYELGILIKIRTLF